VRGARAVNGNVLDKRKWFLAENCASETGLWAIERALKTETKNQKQITKMRFNVAILAAVVIVCSFWKLVDGYINDTKVTTYRDGKFLFDALFGLGEELDLTDGDNKLTKCDCGE
jgi:hypothetical protein